MNGTWKILIGGQSFADYSAVVTPQPASGGPNIMEVPGYGAAAPLFVALLNLKLIRKFIITYQHATDTDAHNWALTAAQTWSGVNPVLLTHMDYEGNETNYLISGAKIEVAVSEPIGPTTITTLTITGGAAVQQP